MLKKYAKLLGKCTSAICILLLISFQTMSANLTDICSGSNSCVLDFESGELNVSIFSLSGEENWSVSNFNTGNGSYALQAPDELEDRGSASISLVVDSELAYIFSFDRRVSSERRYDYLEFYIDGNLAGSWSGRIAWSKVKFAIEAGEHTLNWKYTKDGSVSDWLDKAWIDDMSFDVDTDLDGMPDRFETDNGLNPNDPADASTDADDDGLDNLTEYQLGTLANSADSDGDSMDDFYESSYGLLANDATDAELDLDGDGLSNLQEFTLNTIPNSADSDGDGLDDYQEINEYSTNPLSADTDQDGLSDRDEIEINTDPNLADTDADGMDDLYESSYGLLANDATDAELDLDGDGLSNLQEFTLNTFANSADTDGDGLDDYQEVNEYSTSPLSADTDQDGLSDRDEIEINTDPNLADTDADGMDDLYETSYGLLPGNADDASTDFDQDGLTNLQEFVIGSSPILRDTDSDGSIDGLDQSPLLRPVFALERTDQFGASEVGVFGVNLFDRQLELKIYIDNYYDVFTSTSLRRVISWSPTFRDDQLSMHLLMDINGNGAQEVGVFGMRGSGTTEDKPQFLVKDSLTGERIKTYNWPANWIDCKLIVLDDLNGDGIPEVGLQGLFKIDNKPQLVVKDGATANHLYTYSFPQGLEEPEYTQLNDMNGDGVGEIGFIGTIESTKQLQVRVIDGTDPENSLKAYNFANRWDNPEWVALTDITSDGIPEWGLLGRNKLDGRTQLVVKNGAATRGVEAIYSWPARLQDPQLLIIPDMNNDGIDEFALGGRDDRYRVIVKSGANRGVTLARKNWHQRTENGNFVVIKGDFASPSGISANATIGLVSRVDAQFHLASMEASKLSRINSFNTELNSIPVATSQGDTSGFFYILGIDELGTDNVESHQIFFPR